MKLIEEYAALDQALDNFKPALFRHQKLRELILGWYPGLEPHEEAIAPGRNCDIVISAKDQIRRVTAEGKKKLYRLWGSREFIARTTVFLKELPDPKDPRCLYTVQALSGPRHLRVDREDQHRLGGHRQRQGRTSRRRRC